MEKEEKSLAYELLQEVKHTNKRLFIISLIELAIIVGMIIGFFVYESQYEIVAEQTTVDAGENGTATYLENSESGDIIYGENN